MTTLSVIVCLIVLLSTTVTSLPFSRQRLTSKAKASQTDEIILPVLRRFVRFASDHNLTGIASTLAPDFKGRMLGLPGFPEHVNATSFVQAFAESDPSTAVEQSYVTYEQEGNGFAFMLLRWVALGVTSPRFAGGTPMYGYFLLKAQVSSHHAGPNGPLLSYLENIVSTPDSLNGTIYTSIVNTFIACIQRNDMQQMGELMAPNFMMASTQQGWAGSPTYANRSETLEEFAYGWIGTYLYHIDVVYASDRHAVVTFTEALNATAPQLSYVSHTFGAVEFDSNGFKIVNWFDAGNFRSLP
jgi:hypothetical protein